MQLAFSQIVRRRNRCVILDLITEFNLGKRAAIALIGTISRAAPRVLYVDGYALL